MRGETQQHRTKRFIEEEMLFHEIHNQEREIKELDNEIREANIQTILSEQKKEKDKVRGEGL